jgi:O-antigen/teichoic acid export membrane protein
MSWRSIAATVANVSTTVIGVSLVLAGADAATYALSFPVGSLIQFSIVGIYYLRHRPIRWSFSTKVAHALLIGGLPLFLWAFLQTAYGQIDATLLSVIAVGHIEVVGWFGVATQITSVIVMVPLAINAVALPVLCEMHVKSRGDFQAAATRTMVSSLLLLAPLGIGLALASKDAIELLHYPAAFMNSVPVLSLLAIAMPVTGALMVLSTMATAIGQERQWIKISLFAVCIFPPLYIVLIALFQTNVANGAIGAALANLIGETALLVWAWFILPRELRPAAMVLKGLQVGGLAAAMGAVVWVAQNAGAPLFVYAPLGAILYGAGAWLLKLITPGDLAQVRNALLRRRRRGAASSEPPVVTEPVLSAE